MKVSQIRGEFNLTNMRWYLCFSVLLCCYELLQIRQGIWSADFWEHAAVINELSQNLLHPSHPVYLSDKDHCFFSPYSLFLACLCRLLSVTAVEVLEFFSIVNLLLFLICFRFFCSVLYKDQSDRVSTVALALVLLFWGQYADNWSGFFHLGVLHFVLPYPSTLAACVSFLVLGKFFKGGGFKTWSVLTAGLVLVLLIHPPTWLWLCVALSVGSCYHYLVVPKSLFLAAAMILCSFLIALAWPYYDVFALLTTENPLFDAHSKGLYSGIPKKYWPFLVLPFIFIWGKKQFPSPWLFWSAMVMGLIFLVGYATKHFALGRIVSAVAIFSQLLIAIQLGSLWRADLKGKIVFALTILLLVLTSGINLITDKHAGNIFKTPDQSYYTRYRFLEPYCKGRLVLSDPYSNTFLPSLGIKVVAWNHQLYNFPDQVERNRELNEFYLPTRPAANQVAFIKKYNPDFLLVDSLHPPGSEDLLLRELNAGFVTGANGLSLFELNRIKN